MADRIKAFLVHLAGSLALTLIAVAFVFFIWYPFPLSNAVGVTQIFVIIVAVDAVVGPMLTLIIFDRKKKSLRFDLSVVVVLQLLAFGYGLWTVASARPAWIVFNVDRFDLVQSVDIDKRGLGDASTEYRSVSWFGPKWVSAISPSDTNERNKILMESVIAGIDIAQRPNLYRPLEQADEVIKRKARSLEELVGYNSVEDVRMAQRKWPKANAWLPMMAKVRPAVVLVDRQSAKVIAVVDLKPWDI